MVTSDVDRIIHAAKPNARIAHAVTRELFACPRAELRREARPVRPAPHDRLFRAHPFRGVSREIVNPARRVSQRVRANRIGSARAVRTRSVRQGKRGAPAYRTGIAPRVTLGACARRGHDPLVLAGKSAVLMRAVYTRFFSRDGRRGARRIIWVERGGRNGTRRAMNFRVRDLVSINVESPRANRARRNATLRFPVRRPNVDARERNVHTRFGRIADLTALYEWRRTNMHSTSSVWPVVAGGATAGRVRHEAVAASRISRASAKREDKRRNRGCGDERGERDRLCGHA